MTKLLREAIFIPSPLIGPCLVTFQVPYSSDHFFIEAMHFLSRRMLSINEVGASH